MAAKVFLLTVAFAFAVFANAQDDCSCDDPTDPDNKALWKFFADLQTLKMDNESQAVLPGLLSPLVQCNCLEKNRKKRKILPEVEEKPTTQAAEIMDDYFDEESSVPYFHSRSCAKHYVRIGFLCVKEAALLEMRK